MMVTKIHRFSLVKIFRSFIASLSKRNQETRLISNRIWRGGGWIPTRIAIPVY